MTHTLDPGRSRRGSLKNFSIAGVTAMTSLALTSSAFATASGMPWEAPLATILNSISGPVIASLAVLAVIVVGLIIGFTDMGKGFMRFLQIIFGLSIAFAAVSIATTFGFVATGTVF